MKSRFHSVRSAFVPAFICACVGMASSAHAAKTWTGGTDASWGTAGNWVELAIPGTGDTVTFDANSTTNLSITLGANRSVKGLRIVDPVGPVTVAAGNTLTLGTNGIDMGAATQNLNLYCPVSLLGSTRQTWSVPATRNLTFTGAITANAAAALRCDVAAGGSISMTAGTASSLLGTYATYGYDDWAAKDATNTALGGGAAVTGFYTVNAPGTDQVLYPHMDMSVFNTSWVGGQIRIATNRTATTMRFNGGTGGGATGVEIKGGVALTLSGILVTPNYGAEKVRFTTSTVRPASGGSLYIHQHNTAGDLVFESGGLGNNGTNTLTKTGAGRVIVGVVDFLTSTHTLLEGTFQFGNGGATGSMNNAGVAIVNHANLAFNRNDAFTFANPVSGTGSVTMAGSGSLTLSGTNTFTGPANLNSGTLILTAFDDLGAGTAINFDGGTLQWSTGNTTDISSRTITLGANGGGLDTNGNDITLAAPIGNGGTGGLTKKGAGTLTLSAANNYAGTTTVNAGKLVVANTTGSATGSGNVTVTGTGALGGTGTIAGTVTVSSGGVVQPGTGVGDLTCGGLNLATGGKLDLEFSTTPVGNDRVMVTATDGLTLNGGTVNLYQAGTTDPFSAFGTYDLVNFNGTVQGAGASSLAVGNPQPGVAYTFNVVGNTLQLTLAAGGLVSHWMNAGGGNWADPGSWSGTIPGAATDAAILDTNLVSGPGTILLNSAKTLGSLVIESAANSYTLAPGTAGTLTFDNGTAPADLEIKAGEHVISAPVTLTSGLAISTVGSADRITLSGGLAGTGVLTMEGPGTALLSGANSASGGIVLKGGTVGFDTASLGSNPLTFDGGQLRWTGANADDISAVTVTIAGGGAVLDTNGNNVILASPIGDGGAGGLTKTGAGTLELQASNTYNGATSIQGGVLAVATDAALGAVPAVATADSLVIGNGSLRATGSFVLSPNRGITLAHAAAGIEVTTGSTLTCGGTVTGTGTLNVTGGGTLSLTGLKTHTGGTVVTDAILQSNSDLPANIVLEGTGGLSFTGTRYLNGLTVNGTNSVANTSAGVIFTIATLTAGSGTMNLTNAYVTDFTGSWGAFGGTIVCNGGGYRFNGTGGNNSATLDLNASGIAVRNNATAIALGGLKGSATAVLGGPSHSAQLVTFTIGGNDASTTFAGAITNGGFGGKVGLTKTGTGTLTLSGPNTYTGNTVVNDGTINLATDGQLTFKVAAGGAGTSVSGAGTVVFDGKFNLDLTDPAAHVNGASWQLVQPAGFASITYGPTFELPGFTETANVWTKVAGGQTWVFDEATGVLSLALAGYSSWTTDPANGLTAGVDDGPAQDPDYDGINNLLEYVLGGIPAGAGTANPGILPGQTLDATNLVLTFRRSDLSESDTVVKVQWSTDLVTWNDFATIGAGDALPAVDVTEDAPTAALDTVVVTIPRAGHEAGGKLYGRVQVVK